MIVCFGEVLWDIFGDKKRLGGAPFNVAAIASIFKMESVMITAVGDDDLGKEILEEIEDLDVEVIAQLNDKPTGTVKVTLDAKKQPSFDIKDNVAYDHIEFDDFTAEVCKEADFFCFGALGTRNHKSRSTLIRCLNTTKALKLYDYNYRAGDYDWKLIFNELIQHTNILKINETELKLIKEFNNSQDTDEKFIRYLIKTHNLRYVFITKGENGAELYTKDNHHSVPAPKVNVVDTTGCGDAFTAGIVYSLKNKFEEKEMLDYAVDLASKNAAHKGAIPKL